MKTYSLHRIVDFSKLTAVLNELLPGQHNPWVLMHAENDPIAYFNVVDHDIDIVGPAVMADISGRHFESDKQVIDILIAIQDKVGGEITSDA